MRKRHPDEFYVVRTAPPAGREGPQGWRPWADCLPGSAALLPPASPKRSDPAAHRRRENARPPGDEQGPERWSAPQGSRQASAPSWARPQDGAASTARPRQAAAQGLPRRGPHRTARTRDRGRSVRGRPRAPILTGPRASLPSGPTAPGRPLLPA